MRKEFEFITELSRQAARGAPDLVQGIGDDCAIVSQHHGYETLLSSDLLVEEIHFRLTYTTPALLGHKALAVSLSDIAAMGGVPRFCLTSVALPPHLSDAFLDEFYQGLLRLADAYQVRLIGGDTSASPDRLVIDLTIIGECPAGKAVRRRGAQPGDLIYVTGSLGGAAAGLKLLQRGYQPVTESPNQMEQLMNQAIEAHLAPQPRVFLAQQIRELVRPTSMIDLSDGLSSDLNHICQRSGVGAIIQRRALPVSPTLSALREDAIDLALNGGEDYELLFTVPPDRVVDLTTISTDVPITCIGEITTDQQLQLEGPEGRAGLLPRGYEHFAR